MSYKKSLSNIEKDIILTRYLAGEAPSKIALDFNISGRSIHRWMEKRGIARGITRIYSIDETYFYQVDTEEKAYWLGFILADGCVSHKKRLSFNLQLQDWGHLEKLKKALNSTHPIHKLFLKGGFGEQVKINGGSYRANLIITSANLYRSLGLVGISPRKSLTADPNLDKIPIGLHRHFWRGVIDGDGSLSGPTTYNKNRFTLSLVGSKKTCEKFSEWANTVSGSKGNITKKPDSPLYSRTIGGRQKVLILVKILYDGASIYLDRKKLIADHILLFDSNGIHWSAKFSRDDILEIRKLYETMSSIELARLFRVNKTSVLNIIHRKTYRSV